MKWKQWMALILAVLMLLGCIACAEGEETAQGYTPGMFLCEEYIQTLLLNETPALPITEAGDSDALSAAVNAPGGTFLFTGIRNGDTLHPFLPAQDGSSAAASNIALQGSTAAMCAEIPAKAGDVFIYEYTVTGSEVTDCLTVLVGADPINIHSGNLNWSTGAIRFEADGVYPVSFLYLRGEGGGYQADCQVKNIRLLTGAEAENYEMPAISGPKSLSGAEIAIDLPQETFHKLLSFEADGTPVENAEIVFYVAAQEPVRLKLRVGRDVDLQRAAVSLVGDGSNEEMYLLQNLEQDDDGYLITISPSASRVGIKVGLMADGFDPLSNQETVIIGDSAEAAKQMYYTWFKVGLKQADSEERETILGYGGRFFGYEDGVKLFGMQEILDQILKEEKEEADTETDRRSVYTIVYTDVDGKPVSGVMTQFCDDSSCHVAFSDENGTAVFEGEPYAYEVHVLQAPEEYQPVEELYVLPEEGGTLAITLAPAIQ